MLRIGQHIEGLAKYNSRRSSAQAAAHRYNRLSAIEVLGLLAFVEESGLAIRYKIAEVYYRIGHLRILDPVSGRLLDIELNSPGIDSGPPPQARS